MSLQTQAEKLLSSRDRVNSPHCSERQRVVLRVTSSGFGTRLPSFHPNSLFTSFLTKSKLPNLNFNFLLNKWGWLYESRKVVVWNQLLLAALLLEDIAWHMVSVQELLASSARSPPRPSLLPFYLRLLYFCKILSTLLSQYFTRFLKNCKIFHQADKYRE